MKELKIIGIDLAAKEKNPSGICFLQNCILKSFLLKTDDEILNYIFKIEPNLIAFDAPLTNEIDRICDKLMKKYGAMPLKMKSIMDLASRAISLKNRICNEFEVEIIEVFPTGTAKILGFYDKDLTNKLSLLSQKLEIVIKKDVTKDELDAVIAALTGFIHTLNLSEKVGDTNGWIVVPYSKMIEQIVNEIKQRQFKLI